MKLKSILFVFIIFLNSFLNVGLTANFHFCGGKLSNISFINTSKNQTCSNGCSLLQSKSCCADIIINLDTHSQLYQSTKAQHHSFNQILVDEINKTFSFINQYISFITESNNYNYVPIQKGRTILLNISTFLI
jgi:hypothetical protein